MGSCSSKSSATNEPAGTVTLIDRAVLDLKNTRDRLSRYKTKTSLDCDKLLSRARSLTTTTTTTHTDTDDTRRKATALNLLKLRRYKLNQIGAIDSQLLTIETMVANIATKEEEREVLAALRTGKDALQKLHEENSVEDVLKLMDEVEEQNEMEREINGVVAGCGADALGVEELREVEEELAALERELEGDRVDEDIQMPDVPFDELPAVGEAGRVEGTAASRQPERIALAS